MDGVGERHCSRAGLLGRNCYAYAALGGLNGAALHEGPHVLLEPLLYLGGAAAEHLAHAHEGHGDGLRRAGGLAADGVDVVGRPFERDGAGAVGGPGRDGLRPVFGEGETELLERALDGGAGYSQASPAARDRGAAADFLAAFVAAEGDVFGDGEGGA